MKSGIYMILNIVNNKYYIGSTSNLPIRKSNHFTKLKQNKHVNQHLQYSYNKYGKDAFSFIILENCDRSDLIERELYWMTLKNSHNKSMGYNIGVPKKNDNITLSDECKETRREYAYKQHKIEKEYDIWKQEIIDKKLQQQLFPKKTKRKVIQIDAITGDVANTYDTISSIAINMNYTTTNLKKVELVLSKNPLYAKKKSYKGFVYVYAEDYDSTKDYKRPRITLPPGN